MGRIRLGLRKNGICTSQISRNVRELEWCQKFSFDFFQPSLKPDKTPIWPQSLWKEFSSDRKFPLFYQTNGEGIRRLASKSHQNVSNEHHEINFSPKPLEALGSRKRPLPSILYAGPIQNRKKAKEGSEDGSLVDDIESESEAEVVLEAPLNGPTSYTIRVKQIEPEEPVHRIDLRNIKKPIISTLDRNIELRFRKILTNLGRHEKCTI